MHETSRICESEFTNKPQCFAVIPLAVELTPITHFTKHCTVLVTKTNFNAPFKGDLFSVSFAKHFLMFKCESYLEGERRATQSPPTCPQNPVLSKQSNL